MRSVASSVERGVPLKGCDGMKLLLNEIRKTVMPPRALQATGTDLRSLRDNPVEASHGHDRVRKKITKQVDSRSCCSFLPRFFGYIFQVKGSWKILSLSRISKKNKKRFSDVSACIDWGGWRHFFFGSGGSSPWRPNR